MKINSDLFVGDTGHTLGEIQFDVSDLYSTTETKTKKIWIDGKPIYRKVVTGTVAAPNSGQTVTTISGISQILTIRGVIYSNYGQWWNIPNYHGEAGYVNSIYCDANGRVNLGVGNFYNAGKPFIVILEYTKSS